MTAVLFSLAAALGATGRFVLGRLERSWQSLLIANTVGSLLLGIVFAAELSTDAEVVLGVGLCGALTTFSSFAEELRQLGPAKGAGYAAITVTCSAGAIALVTALA